MPNTQLPVFDMNFHSGDTEYLSLQYRDGEGVVIAIKSGVIQIKSKIYDVEPILTCSAVIQPDFTAFFKFTPEMTMLLRPQGRVLTKYFYDARVVTVEGDVKTLIQGGVNVTYNITESANYTYKVTHSRDIARKRGMTNA